jgi:hypothetical protein
MALQAARSRRSRLGFNPLETSRSNGPFVLRLHRALSLIGTPQCFAYFLCSYAFRCYCFF